MINLGKIWEIFITKYPAFLEGVAITLELAFFTVLFGSLIGLAVAIFRHTHFLPLRWLMNAYVAFIRGTPLLVQVLLIVYGLPQLGVRLPRLTMCIIALVINCGAYMAELIRSGLQSVERGQTEAAESLGMSGAQTMLYIILPQAIKVTLPAMGNEFVAIIKESSIVSVIGIADLMYRTNGVKAKNYKTLECLFIAAMIYFIMTFIGGRLIALMERRMNRGRK